MHVSRTRMLAAALGAALLVTSVGPAAVLAAKPADKGNPHATEPAPEPTAEPSAEPTIEPTVEPTAAPTSEPTAAPTAAPAADPTATATQEEVAPTADPAPGQPRATTDGGGASIAVVTALQLTVAPETYVAGDTITITATLVPDPGDGCGDIDFSYNGIQQSGTIVGGVASTTYTAVSGLHLVTAQFDGGCGVSFTSNSVAIDLRADVGEVSLEADPTTAVQYEDEVVFTFHLPVSDATGTVHFMRDVNGTPGELGTGAVSGATATFGSTTLPAGTYDVYAFYDGDDSYLPSANSNSVQVTITGDTSVKTSSLAVQYSRFYPKKDGYRDTDKISGRTLEPATVTIRIYTSGGTRVKTFSLGSKNGTYSATWTGRKTDGSLLREGTYTVKQSFKDARGNTKTVNQSIVLSHKKLYWYTTSQTRYADTGAFAYDGDGGAYHSKTWSHGVVLLGGSAGYAAARYTFTLPSATIYSSLRASVYGKSVSGFGKGYIGIRNFSNDNLDAFRYVGYSTDWYSNSVGASGHLTSTHKVQLWAFADSGNFGAVNYLKVKLSYKYAVLKY